MKCLVTGATGFIGRELCQQLDAQSIEYLALSSRGGTLPSGQSTIALDLADELIDPVLLRNVDVVFHLAGIAHQQAADDLYEQVNHQATINLARAAAKEGVQRFVFLSSVKAMGPPHTPEPRTESDSHSPNDAYGRSKLRAEQALCDEYNDGGSMSVVILRPTLVYGERASGNLALMVKAVRAGVPRPPAIGRRSMIARDDLVKLLLQMMHTQGAVGVSTWIASGDRGYSAREIHDLMRSALGKAPARAWLPGWAWRVGCMLMDIARSSPRGSMHEKIFGTELYSHAALSTALDWQPRLSLEDVVSQLVSPDAAAGERSR